MKYRVPGSRQVSPKTNSQVHVRYVPFRANIFANDEFWTESTDFSFTWWDSPHQVIQRSMVSAAMKQDRDVSVTAGNGW